jgi:hypothetical protein
MAVLASAAAVVHGGDFKPLVTYIGNVSSLAAINDESAIGCPFREEEKEHAKVALGELLPSSNIDEVIGKIEGTRARQRNMPIL